MRLEGDYFIGPPGYGLEARIRKVGSEGSGRSGILCVGEAAGKNEAKDGLPFRPYAEAGSVLERALYRAGIDRQGLTIANCVWWQPPRDWLDGAPWEMDSIRASQPFLDELISQRAPRVIVALGGVAMRELTGFSGEKQGIGLTRGFIVPSVRYRRGDWKFESPTSLDGEYEQHEVPWPQIPVIGTYHPSFLRRGSKERTETGPRGKTDPAGGGTQGMALLGVLIRDLQLAAEVAKKGSPVFKYDTYTLGGVIDDWRSALGYLRANPEQLVSYDFETQDSLIRESEEEHEHTRRDVTQVQISWRPGQALVSPWTSDLLPILREILELPNPKIDWNGRKFDRPILRDMGIRTDIGEWNDGMDLWHFIQPDLPRGLQYATSFFVPEVRPWKNLSLSDPLWYGCLTGESRLIQWDGDPIRIKDVVNKRLPVILRGLDGEGNPIPVKVIDWHSAKAYRQKWLRLKTEATDQPLYLTPDHKVWTQAGWKPAGEVVIGDRIPIHRSGTESLIHGSLLGDGHVDPRGRFQLGHSETQLEWFELKRAHVEGPKYKPAQKTSKVDGITRKFYHTEIWVSKTLWREKFYDADGNRRFVPPEDDAALAVWYCDNGTWARADDKYIGNPRLHCHVTNLAELVRWMEAQFGLGTISLYDTYGTDSGKIYSCVALIGDAIRKFFTRIAPWVPPCMDYKLPFEFRNKYNGWLEKVKSQWSVVTSIGDHKPPHGSLRYCVTVDHPTHRFFAMGGLVKNCLDVDMPQRIFTQLKRTMQLTRNPHSGQSLWGDGKYSGYTGQVLRLAPVLDRMTERGIPVDEDRRSALDVQFSATLLEQFAEMQDLMPQEIRGLHVYKKSPEAQRVPCEACDGTGKSTVNTKKSTKTIKCRECSGKGTRSEAPELGAPTTVKIGSKGEEREVETQWTQTLEEVQEKCGCWWSGTERQRAKAGNVTQPDCPKCQNTGKVQVQRTLWAKIEPFLPGSWQQVLKYIKWNVEREKATGARKLYWSVPLDYKSGRETTGEAELRRLAAKTKDLLLPRVLDYREIAKLRGTYVKGWEPSGIAEYTANEHSPDCASLIEPEEYNETPGPCDCGFGRVRRIGRVHPSFGFKPATGQTSSENPNAQNFPSHSDLAHAMNKMIAAIPGKKMAKLDWKSFHAITGGFEYQDVDFVRIARVDIHSFFVLVGILKIERPEVAFNWSPADLKDRLNWWRRQTKTYSTYSGQKHPGGMTFDEIRDEIAKKCIYGWEFGQGPRLLWHLNQESFKDISQAKEFQDILRELFHKTNKGQDIVRLEADEQHCLVSRYGYVRRFWDVYQRKPVADNYEAKKGDKIYQSKNGMRWLLKPGDDHESATSFRPSNNAFGIKRSCLVKFGELGLDEKYGLIDDVHDDVRFEYSTRLEDSMISDIQGIMEAKSPYLVDPVIAPDGLWVAVDVKVGPDWDSLEKVSG